MQRLSRTVPSNITGVCMTSATRRRSSRGSNDRMSRPSNRTVPEVGSTRRLRQRSTRLPRSGRADKRERVPPLHAERHIVQDFHCGITSTTRIGEREMIDLENRIVPVVVGSGNLVVAHCSLVVQNTHPVKLSQASSQDYQLDRQSVSRIFRRLVCVGKHHEIAVSPHIRSQIYPDSETHHVS